MTPNAAPERAACPLCGAHIPYRRRFKEFWSTHPGQPVLLLCGGCGRYVQDRRHVYWWRVPHWLLISLPLWLIPARRLIARWPDVEEAVLAVAPAANFWVTWIVLVTIVGTLAMPCLLRFTHAADDELCRGCGYDLRGSPGLNCPECGRRREAAASRAIPHDAPRPE